MSSRFNSQFFSNNREKLRTLFIGTAPIVITANGLLQRGADSTYAFSQDASFWYLTGIDDPDIILVMDKSQEYLIIPSHSKSKEIFDGAIDLNALSETSGVTKVYGYKEGWDKLSQRIKKVKHIATIGSSPSYIEQYGFYVNPARARLISNIKLFNESIDILDLSSHLVKMRTIKSAEEILAIKDAIKITEAALKETLKKSNVNKYKYELDIEAEFTKAVKLGGAKNFSFEPIIASGISACILHNISNNSKVNKNDLLLIDAGVEVEHYASDITRTYSLSTPTRRQKTVYQAVLEVQEYAISLLKPGVILRDYEQKIEHFMGEKLRSLGLIKNIDHDLIRQYYPHASSHFLGLNVHDVGNYETPLMPGSVITAEPGIYIKEEALGIRIEDDVLITSKGNEVLSKLPKETL